VSDQQDIAEDTDSHCADVLPAVAAPWVCVQAGVLFDNTVMSLGGVNEHEVRQCYC
jgi:hypothetical protein